MSTVPSLYTLNVTSFVIPIIFPFSYNTSKILAYPSFTLKASFSLANVETTISYVLLVSSLIASKYVKYSPLYGLVSSYVFIVISLDVTVNVPLLKTTL